MIVLDEVTRIEIIDHTKTPDEGGARTYVKWEKAPFFVEIVKQDDNRTMKVFIYPNEKAV